MEGRGSIGGSKSPALFTSLELSQQLQSKNWLVNMLRVSLDDNLGASESIPDVKMLLNKLINAESAGFEVNIDDDAMSIQFLEPDEFDCVPHVTPLSVDVYI